MFGNNILADVFKTIEHQSETKDFVKSNLTEQDYTSNTCNEIKKLAKEILDGSTLI